MTIDSFTGANLFLSNFSLHRVVMHDGTTYLTSEHAYQAAKALTRADHDLVASQPTPGTAKRAGRRVACRRDWEQVKDAVMLEIIRAKFRRGTALAALLEATGDEELVEGNTWGDRYWGVCGGQGQNKLGVILMHVRSQNRTVGQGEVT